MTRARLLALALPLLVIVGPATGAGTPSLAGTWRGTFTLPRVLPLSVTLQGKTATVALPVGHPAPAAVTARISGLRIQFSLPGRPGALRFDGRLRAGRTLAGTVSQAGLEGTFALRRGSPLTSGDLGVYDVAGDHPVAVVLPGDRRLLVAYDAAEIHGLFGGGSRTWALGAGLGVRDPVAGSVHFTSGGLDVTLGGATRRATRRAVKELEVRFRSGSLLLAGTLSLPTTPGRHAAVALVHGSGATPRTDEAVYTGYYVSRGFAVLAYDKRGIAQSGGRYPGESASAANIDRYARDAEAAARFLAAQPEVDPARVGLSGSSQAGWIMPLAASRESAIRFLVAVSGPTVTEGEQGTYHDLTTGGASAPSQAPAQILAEVRAAGPSGFDPLPAIRKLRVPALWLFGAIDQHVPTALCVERLAPIAAEQGRDFRYVVFPGADHFLIESAHGLTAEVLRSSRYAPAFSTLDAWLLARAL